jgi:hypothetical protein
MLDIDGVLNSRDWVNRRQLKDYEEYASQEAWDAHSGMDLDAVARLNTIVEQTDCEIVISSTWRMLYPGKGSVKSEFAHVARMLVMRGFKYPEKITGATPELRNLPRGDEIQAWLDANLDNSPFSLCILDDDSDMAHLIEHLVCTFDTQGLQDKHITEVKEMLNV